ncbi:E3 binding domain-containing protein [Arsenicicoccus bolidensis]|uniref:E3 binding domain-containing protein n=1 Tax=Arsenicicoccus bolidensis TaxID=229480 RepID=UPI000417FF8C
MHEPEVEVADGAGSRPGKALAKPPVRKYAKDKGVDLTAVTGTGDGGVVTRADVDAYLAGSHRALIRADAGRWHLVHGQIYSQERQTFVVASWAEACNEHRDTVAAAVCADVDDWRDRWEVQIATYDYASPEAGGTTRTAHGAGTFQDRLF